MKQFGLRLNKKEPKVIFHFSPASKHLYCNFIRHLDDNGSVLVSASFGKVPMDTSY